jgi:hypothetical protein
LFKNVPNNWYLDTNYSEFKIFAGLRKQLNDNQTKMSYYNEIIIGLALGGTLLWWWKTSEEEKVRKQEQEHRQFIQNLALTQDFNQIRILSIDDFTLLLSFLSPEDASKIRTQKRDYEERLRLEGEERERQAAIERERLRLEEERKRQIRMIEMADNFDTNVIKHLNDYDFRELVKHLNESKIVIATAVRNTYQTELRLKREADSLRAETERLRLERARLERERERERQNDLLRIRTQEIITTNALEYQKGLDRGEMDGALGNHAANSWDWFFTTSEFKQGYEIGYNRTRQRIQKEVKLVVVDRSNDRSNDKSNVDQKVANASREIKNQINRAVEKMGEELKEEINKVKGSNEKEKEKEPKYCMVELANPYIPVNEEPQEESDSESDSEQEKKEQETHRDIEKQMNVLDMMMHN